MRAERPTTFPGNTAPVAIFLVHALIRSGMPPPRHEALQTRYTFHLKPLILYARPLDAIRRTFRGWSRSAGEVQGAPRILRRMQRGLTPRDYRTHGRKGHHGNSITAEHARVIFSGRGVPRNVPSKFEIGTPRCK